MVFTVADFSGAIASHDGAVQVGIVLRASSLPSLTRRVLIAPQCCECATSGLGVYHGPTVQGYARAFAVDRDPYRERLDVP